MSNVYNRVNPRSFKIRSLGLYEDMTVFLVECDNHSALDVCVFRDGITRFMLEDFDGDFDLENGTKYIDNCGNNLVIAIEKPIDIERLKMNYTVIA